MRLMTCLSPAMSIEQRTEAATKTDISLSLQNFSWSPVYKYVTRNLALLRYIKLQLAKILF